MLINYLNAFAPLISLLINVCVQLLSFRIMPRLGLLKSVFLGFVFGLVSLFIHMSYGFFVHMFPIKDLTADAITKVITYLCLGYCYFVFINLGETARRIRILRELYDSPGGLSLEEILKRYSAREIVERRLSRLIKNSQIIYENDRYYIGQPVMLSAAKLIVVFKFVLLGRYYETDQYSTEL